MDLGTHVGCFPPSLAIDLQGYLGTALGDNTVRKLPNDGSRQLFCAGSEQMVQVALTFPNQHASRKCAREQIAMKLSEQPRLCGCVAPVRSKCKAPDDVRRQQETMLRAVI